MTWFFLFILLICRQINGFSSVQSILNSRDISHLVMLYYLFISSILLNIFMVMFMRNICVYMCLYTYVYTCICLCLCHILVSGWCGFKTTNTSVWHIPVSPTFCKSLCKFPLLLPLFQNSSGLTTVFVLRLSDKLQYKCSNFSLDTWLFRFSIYFCVNFGKLSLSKTIHFIYVIKFIKITLLIILSYDLSKIM